MTALFRPSPKGSAPLKVYKFERKAARRELMKLYRAQKKQNKKTKKESR